MNRKVAVLAVILAAFGVARAVFIFMKSKEVPSQQSVAWPLTWDKTPVAITEECHEATKQLVEEMDRLAALPDKDVSLSSLLLKFEAAFTSLGEKTNPLTFYKDVSPDLERREASDKCEQAVRKVAVDLFAREDLYLSLKRLRDHPGIRMDAVDQKLLAETLEEFEFSGLKLPQDQRPNFTAQMKQLVELTSKYQQTLGEWKATLLLSAQELAGVSENFLKGLEKQGDLFVLTTKYPHFNEVMDYANAAGTRKRMYEFFNQRGGTDNRDLLQKAVELRALMAHQLGFDNHASFKLRKRMAKTTGAVDSFLKDLIERLRPLGTSDIEALLALKKVDDPKATELHAWDTRYYHTRLKKEKFSVDNEEIKKYFPAEKVIAGMFKIYKSLLGVDFIPEIAAPTWHPDVKAFSVQDQGKTIAYFYMDLFPREGKYGHAAAFTLKSGYVNRFGAYEKPVAAIVANFTPAQGDQPSLLLHAEVETLFHEFGHVMHQVLTRARYASYSGTSVRWDFVEAPSQMLENWVWESEGLREMSGHYQTNEPIPEELIQKLVAAKKVGYGLFYLRQLFLATYDYQLHTVERGISIDTTQKYLELMASIVGIQGLQGTIPEASFGHLMGGYDAGYYGYLWSEVFAADMFTRFKNEGLLNAKTGRDYRTWILESGGEREPMELIEGFLGRASNNHAFLESIGLNNINAPTQTK